MTFRWNAEAIHFNAEGAGPPLVLLHGLGGNADNWLPQRTVLKRKHLVLSLDLPGHGRSSGREVRFADYWQVIEALLDHLELDSAALCGLSKGARAGLALASRRPRRVERMMVVNAFVHLTPADKARRLALYALLAEPGGVTLWAQTLLDWMGVSDRPVIVRGFMKSLATLDPAHIRRIFGELSAYDQRPELAEIVCPVLLVRGQKDGFVPDYCVEDLRRCLPDSRIVRMPECGHLPYLEQSISFNQIAAAFLGDGSSHAARSGGD
jgi:pimeloyl-ACP methyl ester carboxylesterase